MPDIKARIRAALDEELGNQTWTLRDPDGHVELVDGDVDTGALAAAVVEALGFTPEWARGWDGKDGQRQHAPPKPNRDDAVLFGSTITNDPIEIRYVTQWGAE